MKTFLEKIYHTIVPHKKNGNIPHILKKEFIVVITVFVGILFYFNQYNFDIIRKLNLSATVYPAVLADLTNKDRLTSGVSELRWNDTLQKAAKLKAEDMLKNSYFAHTSPNGVTPWHWFREADYNFIYAGENLAVDFTESDIVQKAWLNSPKHKENIMNSNFTEIGIATADGMFEGKDTTFVVEFFGKPSIIKIIENPIVKNDKKVSVDVPANPISPTVAGAITENIIEPEKIIPEKNIPEVKIIKEDNQFIVVQNEQAVDSDIEIKDNTSNETVSATWYYRFIVNPTNTIKVIYIVFLGLIFIAILLMLLKDYQKHQSKHLIRGISLLIIIIVLFYIISTNSPSLF